MGAFMERSQRVCLCPVNLPASFIGNRKWKIVEDRVPGDWLIVPKYGTAEG
ncbi:hypothetical protein V5F77_05475 [Xanthobacter sp. DSM 24535]|uniref:hypothetical protein n=1 Tax=Roseixanthobacter psychrophilus TaxID=3119917 RepID=UPI003727666F